MTAESRASRGRRQGAGGGPTLWHERESKLTGVPGGIGPALAGLGEGFVLRSTPDHRLVSTYWDTDDLRLARWGCTLRRREGEGWTVKLPEPALSDGHRPGTMDRIEARFDAAGARPPAAALDLVQAFARRAELTSTMRLVTLRRSLVVERPEGHPVVEVDVDEVTARRGGKLAARFSETEVELLDGEAAGDAATVLQRLRSAGAEPRLAVPKLARAMGEDALGPPDVVVRPVEPDATAGEVIRRALAASVTRLVRHDPLVRLGVDPEAVHQARVATRRLRSDLHTFEALLDPTWVAATRDELQWLAAGLGAVRDAEVLRDRLAAASDRLPPADRPAAAAITDRLSATVTAERSPLAEMLRSARYLDLLDRLVEATASPPLSDVAATPAAELVPALVSRTYRRLRNTARGLPDDPAPEQAHELRIRAKRARYAADVAGPIAGGSARALSAALATLQDELGEHHDAVVAQQWLRAQAGRGRVAFVAGELCALEERAAARALRRWPRAWKRASRRSLRAWLE